MGLAAAALHRREPRPVVYDISGYGNDGLYRERKVCDLRVQSESGFLSVTGTAQELAKAGASVANIATGLYACTSILSALLLRRRTGQGFVNGYGAGGGMKRSGRGHKKGLQALEELSTDRRQ